MKGGRGLCLYHVYHLIVKRLVLGEYIRLCAQVWYGPWKGCRRCCSTSPRVCRWRSPLPRSAPYRPEAGASRRPTSGSASSLQSPGSCCSSPSVWLCSRWSEAKPHGQASGTNGAKNARSDRAEHRESDVSQSDPIDFLVQQKCVACSLVFYSIYRSIFKSTFYTLQLYIDFCI